MAKYKLQYTGDCIASAMVSLFDKSYGGEISNLFIKNNEINMNTTQNLSTAELDIIKADLASFVCPQVRAVLNYGYVEQSATGLKKCELVFNTDNNDITIFSAINIESITNVSAGVYKIHFVQPFQNINYGIVGNTHVEGFSSYTFNKIVEKTLDYVVIDVYYKKGYVNLTSIIFLGDI